MATHESAKIFSTFLLFLSLIRLWDNDLIGFSVFLVFSILFYCSGLFEGFKSKRSQKMEDRRRVFSRLSTPRISSRNEGNSEITTLIVPSLDFFNEMRNDGDISSKR